MWAQAEWFARQGSLRWAILVGVFFLCALWETFKPRRVLIASTARRWANHALVAFAFNSPLAWLLRLNGVLVAFAVADSPYGLLNRPAVPLWARYVLTVLLLDLLRYVQHYLYHRLPFFWRIHRVHHSDPDFDWSTSLLFHPAEMLVTQAVYVGVIALLAPPPFAVLLLELAVTGQNIFVHANVRIPRGLETALRAVMITPEMHRVHHSDDPVEQNTNFGEFFPWWDRLLGTYLAEPAAGHEKMGVGLREMKGPQDLAGILAMPFREPDGGAGFSPREASASLDQRS